MAAITPNAQEIPVKITGSSVFGRYPTISAERTYNMFISVSGDKQEQWLVNFAGYQPAVNFFNVEDEGRGAFHSVRGNFIIVVVAAIVFRVNAVDSPPIQIGELQTTTGEVFMDENLASQICIVDGENAYIYNYAQAPLGPVLPAVNSSGASLVSADLVPNYVCYHNTYFIFGNALTTNAGSQWFIYTSPVPPAAPNALLYVQTLTLQTKPDFAEAALRIPGKGNNIIVLGSTVSEIWNDVGGSQIYQRNASINIDYGCASVATIAANDEIVAWLGINEHSSPAIMVMTGGGAQRLSTDGIDYLLDTIKYPKDSTAIFYRQDGHLFYVLTFFNKADNLTIAYDFVTNMFFDLTDWNFTAHPARQIVYFQGQVYFISYKDGNLYEMGSDILAMTTGIPTNETNAIPRVRVCDTFRLPRPEKFLVDLFTFVIETGTTDNIPELNQCYGYIIQEGTNAIIYSEDNLALLVEGGYCTSLELLPKVDVSISKNGGITFSNAVSYNLKTTGDYLNQPRFNRLGYCTQLTIQMRFWGLGRFVIKNGMIEVRQ